MPEPYAGKLARTVLRGLTLPGYGMRNKIYKTMDNLRVLIIIFLSFFPGVQALAQEEEMIEEISFSNIISYPKELQEIENSLKNMSINEEFLEGLIKEEIDSVKSKFDELNKIRIKENLTGRLEGNGMGSFDVMGCSLGIIGFSSKKDHNNIYRVCYSYFKKPDGQIKIKVITIYNKNQKIAEYPKLYTITGDQIKRLNEVLKKEDNKTKIELLSSFLKNSEKSLKYGIFPYTLQNNHFAGYHGNLSWYYILEGKGGEAIKHAKKGLDLSYGKAKWINVNLIIAYFIERETEKGLELFLKLKEERYKEKTIKDMLTADIKELEKKGFIFPNKMEITKVIEGE